MWAYKSPIGTWVIRKNSFENYELWLDSNCHGTYHSAYAAADDVYTHSTGCYEWDRLEGKVESPRDLSEWELFL